MASPIASKASATRDLFSINRRIVNRGGEVPILLEEPNFPLRGFSAFWLTVDRPATTASLSGGRARCAASSGTSPGRAFAHPLPQ
jgi:hypothetical protein